MIGDMSRAAGSQRFGRLTDRRAVLDVGCRGVRPAGP